MKDHTQTQEKTALEVKHEYEMALTELDTLPTILQLLIDRYDLDSTEHTEQQCLELGNAHDEFNKVLTMVQRRLYEMIESTEKISVNN